MPSLLNKDYDIDSNTQKLASRGRQESKKIVMTWDELTDEISLTDGIDITIIDFRSYLARNKVDEITIKRK